MATAVLFAWWSPNPNPTTNPDFNIGLIFFSLLFFITFRGLFFFTTFGKVLISVLLFCIVGRGHFPVFRDLISGYDGIVILAFFLLPRLHIDRNKLNWHIRLGQPNWLSRLLGYEVGERTCEDFPLEYIEGGLFPFEDLDSIAIPLKQSKTGEKSLSLSVSRFLARFAFARNRR